MRKIRKNISVKAIYKNKTMLSYYIWLLITIKTAFCIHLREN
ncbi:hypothetical protein HMPREF1143_2154 [Peptoanaerobacter stomatis]|uniref:Uncharacterized protein n=1 Tax=Peptoanaerobacter stomatis TaxID=796937 RepID=J6HEM5_9FIRM|nr:hypothetical protein HMPREF1143_2154 [Peptoanaerobacter stomatis]